MITQKQIDEAIENGTAKECALILQSEHDTLSRQEFDDLVIRLIVVTLNAPEGQQGP